jgi:general secretion pathway protein D
MKNNLFACTLVLIAISGCVHSPKSEVINPEKLSTLNEAKKRIAERNNANQATKTNPYLTNQTSNDLPINAKIHQLLSMKVGQPTLFETTVSEGRPDEKINKEATKKASKTEAGKWGSDKLEPLPNSTQTRQERDNNAIADKKIDDETVSISMYEARIDQLLWTLADKLKLNLIVEPKILAMTQRASINIKNIKTTDAIARTMETFDIHAEVVGNTLTVKAMEDRIFNLEILNAKSNLKVDTGGDILGSGNKDGGALKGNVSLGISAGENDDQFSFIAKAVESIIEESGDTSIKPRFSLNRSAGTLYVHAKPSRIKIVSDFLKRTKEIQGRQVQIDVQLVDVKLNDAYSMGIDWTHLTNNVAAVVGSATGVLTETSSVFPMGALGSRILTIPQQSLGNSGTGGGGGILLGNGKYSAVINALGEYGNAQLVSNPSLRLRNGVPAYISVGTNIRIVTKVSTTNTATGTGNSTQSDVQTDSVFSGIVMAVTAQIKDDSSIELFIHPTQSRAREDKLGLVQVSSTSSVTLPIIETKSLATTLNIQNNDTVILGGLVDQQTSDATTGVPGLSDIPLMGGLFRKNNNVNAKRELIIILRARLI